PLLPDRIPEHAVGRFQEPPPPGRHHQPAPGTHASPQLAHGSRHVGREEDAEGADHDVEGAARHVEAGQIAGDELDVVQATRPGLGPGQIEEPLSEVHAENASGRPHSLGGRERGGSRAAADIEHRVTLSDAGKRHASAPEALPERQRRVIEVFGGRIVGSSDSRLDSLSSRNRTHYNYITSSGTFVKPSDRLPPLDYSSSPGRSSGS